MATPLIPMDLLLARLSEELLLQDVPRVEFVVVGGAALILQGLADRVTADVDVVGIWNAADGRLVVLEELPPVVAACAEEVAASSVGGGASRQWLNRGPSSLAAVGLPNGFEARLVRREFGDRLVLHLLGREDLIALKLYAAADGGRRADLHEADLRRLGPRFEELDAAITWIRSLAGTEAFAVREFEVIREDVRRLVIELGFDDLAYDL